MSVYVCVCLLNTQRIFISTTYCHICNEYKREKETHITEIYFISHKTYDEMKVDESVVSASSTRCAGNSIQKLSSDKDNVMCIKLIIRDTDACH